MNAILHCLQEQKIQSMAYGFIMIALHIFCNNTLVPAHTYLGIHTYLCIHSQEQGSVNSVGVTSSN